MKHKAAKGNLWYILQFKNPYCIRRNMKINIIFTTSVDDNNTVLKI